MSGPSYHGRTHLPGGTDPIPGLITGEGAQIGDYVSIAHLFPDLRGYWRLGEGAEPFADTSGYNPADPANLEIKTGTEPMSEDVDPGALPPAYDDGGVGFNLENGGDSPLFQAEYLGGAAGTLTTDTGRFRFPTDPFSIAIWIKPYESTFTFDAGIFCNNQQDPANLDSGWRLWMTYGSANPVVFFERGMDTNVVDIKRVGASVIDGWDVWSHIAVTYDGTDVRLYINGALADDVTDTHNAGGDTKTPFIGYCAWSFWNPSPVTHHQYYYGAADEAAVWGEALTPTQVAQLAGLGAASQEALAGYVLTADGTGGFSWEPPTIEVTY